MFKIVLVSFLMLIALAKADFEDDCLEKHKITQAEITEFSKAWNEATHPVERKFKCYTQCILDAIADKDEHGKYYAKSYPDRDDARNPSEDAIAKGKACNESVEKVEDECEYAFNFMRCVRQRN